MTFRRELVEVLADSFVETKTDDRTRECLSADGRSRFYHTTIGEEWCLLVDVGLNRKDRGGHWVNIFRLIELDGRVAMIIVGTDKGGLVYDGSVGQNEWERLGWQWGRTDGQGLLYAVADVPEKLDVEMTANLFAWQMRKGDMGYRPILVPAGLVDLARDVREIRDEAEIRWLSSDAPMVEVWRNIYYWAVDMVDDEIAVKYQALDG